MSELEREMIDREAEALTNRLEVQLRRLKNAATGHDSAFEHLEFQTLVVADLVRLSRMVRDLARTR